MKYDSDTIFTTSNFIPGKYIVNPGKLSYMGYVYEEMFRYPENSSIYDFVLVNKGEIIALGDELGTCGGILCDCTNDNFEQELKKSSVYSKVKHLPIAVELEKPIYKYFNSYNEYITNTLKN